MLESFTLDLHGSNNEGVAEEMTWISYAFTCTETATEMG